MPEDKKKILVVKKEFVVKRELEAKKNTALYKKLAPSVRELAKQITDVTIPDIQKITLIVADKEKLLQQIDNNKTMELEVHIVPNLQPKP
jgi:hypothetical protein